VLIIVEGPDGAGKTTLAGELESRISTSVDILHRGPPTSHPLDEYEMPLLNYRPGYGDTIICDRWHWGECVYPSVFGRPTRMDAAAFRHIELFLLSRGAVVVLLDPEAEVLRDRLAARGDLNPTTREVQVSALHGFRRVAGFSMLPILRVSRMRTDAAVSHILRVAHKLDTATAQLAHLVTYVGPARPELLLMGDVRHRIAEDPDGPRRLHPAFVPYGSTSGRWLLNGLTQRTLWRVGLANACDVDDPRQVWETVGRPLAVALGRRADVALHAAGVPHGAVPHPQYLRRFFHASADEYHEVLLRSVAGGGVDDLSGWRPANSWLTQPRETVNT